MQFNLVLEDHDLDALMPALAISQAILQRATAKIHAQAQAQVAAAQTPAEAPPAEALPPIDPPGA